MKEQIGTRGRERWGRRCRRTASRWDKTGVSAKRQGPRCAEVGRRHALDEARGRLTIVVKWARRDIVAGANFAARAAVGNAVGDFEFVCAGLHAARDGLGHEVIDELVKAGLTAEVLGTGTQAVSRAPSGHPQLASLLVGYKPVVRLSLFTSTNVARYCLPDHRFPPVRAALPAVWIDPRVELHQQFKIGLSQIKHCKCEDSRNALSPFHRGIAGDR